MCRVTSKKLALTDSGLATEPFSLNGGVYAIKINQDELALLSRASKKIKNLSASDVTKLEATLRKLKLQIEEKSNCVFTK